MKLFYTNASAKEEITGLESRIASLEADGTSAAVEISRLQGELATSNESLLTANTSLEALTADLATATASLATKETELATAKEAVTGFETKVENAALAKFQALGGEATEAKTKEDAEKSNLSGLTGFAKVSAAFAVKK